MDKRTRVLNAMNKKEVDHVPVSFWFHFKKDDLLKDSCVGAHLEYYREADPDFIKVMSDGYFQYPLPEITCVSDWRKTEELTADDPFIVKQVERAKAIVKELGQECCVFYNVFAPFSYLRFGAEKIGMTDAQIMQHIREDRDAVMYAMERIAKTSVMLSELLIKEAGCDGIYYCVQNGERGRFTPEEYKEMIEPAERYVLECANRFSENNILHMCSWSGIPNQLELWKDYPARVMNWAVFVEEMSLQDGREYFGGRTVLGGFETLWNAHMRQGIIYSGTKAEVQEYTKRLICDFGKTGLILGGDCTLDSGIDRERIRWVVEAARSV